MKEITIPEGFKPFKVVINAVEYAFTPGETVTVPDNVAECVEAYINANQEVVPESQRQVYMLTFKPEDKGKALVVNEDGTDLVWGEVAGGGGGLPEISAGDAGKVLTVNQNETEAIWAQSGGIFWITASPVPDHEDDLRLDKTFLEIFNAMQNKLLCVITLDYEEGYDAQHMNVMDVGYSPELGGFVNTFELQFSCSSVNDYPEHSDGDN